MALPLLFSFISSVPELPLMYFVVFFFSHLLCVSQSDLVSVKDRQGQLSHSTQEQDKTISKVGKIERDRESTHMLVRAEIQIQIHAERMFTLDDVYIITHTNWPSQA